MTTAPYRKPGICGAGHRCLWPALTLLLVLPLLASEHHGAVKFNGLPLPGATITATQGDKRLVAVSDAQGSYSFRDLPDGTWTLQVEMLCFSPVKQDVNVSKDSPADDWDLKLLPFNEIKATIQAPPPPPAISSAAEPAKKPSSFQRAAAKPSKDAPPPTTSSAPSEETKDQTPSDGFLINGSVNNGASSIFAQAPAFGNNRKSGRGLYNGGIGFILDNSALDARSFSLTGQDTPKPGYNHFTGLLNFGGPLRIPHLLRNGPDIFVNYQWTHNRNASTQTNLVPTLTQRAGDFSQALTQIFDPVTHAPFAGNVIPQSRISPQALALLSFYPLPNFNGGTRYNYQVPLVGATHQDSLQSRVNKTIGRRNQISGLFALQSTRNDNPNIFNFLDTNDSLGLNASVNWRHNLTKRMFGNLGFQYSRQSIRVVPYFQNRTNVSGAAGITGNNQDPANWGPPALNFASGLASLTDSNSSFNRNQTGALSYSVFWSHGAHNVTWGADYKRLQFNSLSQQNPRGSFTFTGASAGSDFAGFLLGVPDTSAIAFGNADKYFRSSSYDAYITDDWRISPGFTLNAGVRWEYSAPITELYGRLVNLDLTPGFTAEVPVVALNPTGSLTGQHYPDSLINPDKHGFQPRIGISWRPIPASSMVVRGGYGVYYNTSVYQAIATQMAQQPPLSKTLRVANGATDPLTLASGFNASPGITPNTYAIDPNLRVGYAHNWQLSVQRDLPGSLVMTATYLGIKGTRGLQEFFPNTYPTGVASPCPSCPSGFSYLASNGNSTREAGTLQLRRRLHNGFTATLQYTFSKAIDDASLGGRGQGTPLVAQDWLHLNAERGLSNFDQRHQLSLQTQYTTGMGVAGGTLLHGWRGALYKEWTIGTTITAASGTPLTPNVIAAVSGTGSTGSIRPDYTGAPLYSGAPGLALDPAAFVAPFGHWGNAGRDSIIGPSKFSLNASMGRTLRLTDRFNLDIRIDSTNALNHVTYPSWNTTINSAQFGLPMSANAMRSVQTTMRLRF